MKLWRLIMLGSMGVLATLLTLTQLPAQQPTPTPTPTVTSRTATVSGMTVGEVLVGDTVVIRLREPAGGLTPGQRAETVATRLRGFLAEGYSWQDVSVGRMNNQTAVLMGDHLLVTVDQRHADLNRTTPLSLAFQWRDLASNNLRDAIGPRVAGTQETAWPTWTNPGTKIVPIVSVGTPGVRVGFAQVTGPRERVDDVDAVFQVDLVFQRAARIRAFVPSDNPTSLSRVQGVAVTALLQYELFQF